ncbi:MAG: GPW/gp25 family protein [Methylococcaceae bacterium]|nr:GPW/gp25 family protein [Methylococcaceae bacterium]MDD1615185.1 GPW/gp25 family protein [Methylococcaceae bacterium]
MATNADSFLGKGWNFPPSFLQNGKDILMVAEEQDIQQSLQILLSTSQGERVMLENFGCDLNRFLFEEISQSLVNGLNSLIRDSILYYEPRIDVARISVDESKESLGVLEISIEYTVRSTNSRFNMVFPFYLNEATQPST